MKSISFLAIFLLLCCTGWSQTGGGTAVSEALLVTGEVQQELRFGLADLEKLPAQPIPDVVITNHLGQPKGTATQLKGVLLKDLLQTLKLKEESPKRYSEFFFTFIAADQYKVVYSWNEIFNSPTGLHVYLITSKAGKPLATMDDRILVLTTTDFKTGRRHIKGLSRIVVSRVP